MTTPHPLASVHTQNFPEILQKLGVSLLVSTYQAGKLVLLRADGDHINTHFANLKSPMGIACRADGSQFAVGSATDIRWFRNVPSVCGKLPATTAPLDACYLPASNHITGGIDIHEMALDAEQQLWFINTRFSCLCTYDQENHFTPRWHPEWISQLAPEDRCHLNGLGMRDEQPRYVTALGDGDKAGSWRQNKVNGGLLMDISDHRIIATGLSMPHSPRWYRNQLWVLESGKGQLCTVDEYSGERTVVCTIKGFTRGLSFVGPLAFIGVSQVRESATFSGLEITERYTAEERECGVWVVNIESAQPIAFLRFTQGVNEIFAVNALPKRFPELLETNHELLASTWMVPSESLGAGWQQLTRLP